MEKMFKSIITILFVIAFMILTMVMITPSVFATGDPVITTDFYVYTPNVDGGYKVSLNSNFKTAINSSVETSYTGYTPDGDSLTWNTGDPLPNPAPKGEYNGRNVTDMRGLFSYCEGMTSLDLSNFNTQNVTSMNSMFSRCRRLTNLNLSNFDTQNVTDMSMMFLVCEGLTNLNISKFDTSNVTDMNGMFCDCVGLTNLYLSNFDTSKVTNMSGMFCDCVGLTNLYLSNFDTSKVTYMNGMFYGCTRVTNLDVSDFDTSKVTNMNGMFRGCSGLTNLNLGGVTAQNVTDMGSMFYGCSGLISLNLSSFNTQKVRSMDRMFMGCNRLTNLDLSNFDLIEGAAIESMFTDCSSSVSEDIKPALIIVKSSEVKITLNSPVSGIKSSDLKTLIASTLTIKDNLDKVYDGKPVAEPKDITQTENTKKPEYTWYQKQASGEWKLIDSTPRNCGEYKVLGIVDIDGDYYNCKAEKEFEITKADNSWRIEPFIEDWSYGYKANTPKAESKYGSPTYKYYSDANCTVEIEKPTEIGSYYVKAYVAETDNYMAIESAPVVFKIVEAINGEDILAASEEKGGAISDMSDEDIVKLFTKEELDQAAVEEKEVKVLLEIKKISPTDSVKDLIEDGIDQLGLYLDISIYKYIGEDKDKIEELPYEITIIYNIPEELQDKNKTFYMIREHNGEITKLKDLDDKVETITFKTDEFSTYALAYTENSNDIAATGDNSLMVWVLLLMLSLIAIAVITRKMHRN